MFRPKTKTMKIIATLSLLGVAAAIAGLGTFATFTSSTPAQTESVGSGKVQIDLGTTGTAANRMSVAATNMAAGDTMERSVDLINSSTVPLSSIKLTTTATTSSVLDTDATNGLQMEIRKCSVAWTEAGTAPAYTYTCSGTETVVVATSPVIQAATTLANMSLAAAATDRLRIKLTLPTAADNTFQNKNSVVSFVFTATQTTTPTAH